MSPATQQPLAVVILISGGGTNLQAIIDGVQDGSLPIIIRAVISNKARTYGLERAQQAGIATAVLDHKDFAGREPFDEKLHALIENYEPNLVVLAGFMRILTDGFVEHYRGRMLNIHPALLPDFPGLHTHERALKAGVKQHGASVHFVTTEVDGGPIIIQARVAVRADDTADILAARVLKQEHRILPQAIRWFAENRLQLQGHTVLLDDKTLPTNGIDLADITAA